MSREIRVELHVFGREERCEATTSCRRESRDLVSGRVRAEREEGRQAGIGTKRNEGVVAPDTASVAVLVPSQRDCDLRKSHLVAISENIPTPSFRGGTKELIDWRRTGTPFLRCEHGMCQR